MRVAPCPALAWHTSSSRVGILRRTSFFSGVQCESSVHDSGWPRSPRKDITASECNTLPTFDFVVP
jgi:hypothetical protein